MDFLKVAAIVVVTMLGTIVSLPATAEECEGAHRGPCADLIGAEVFFEQVRLGTFEEHCGTAVDACAVLNVSRKECIIYYHGRTIPAKTVNHEMNHCRGWFHTQQRATKYNRPWVDINTYLGA